jgi:hypothetical protein
MPAKDASMFDLAAQTLLSPAILCFALGLAAAFARSDLSFPEAVAKGMSLYLLFSIGFKGGVGVAEHGVDAGLIAAILVGAGLSFVLPFVAFALLRSLGGLGLIDAAAIAAHYGSISIVTFLAATSVLEGFGLTAEAYMVAVAAAMEAPAIVAALWIVARRSAKAGQGAAAPLAPPLGAEMMREILLNGSIVLLVGAFVIGWITGPAGLDDISAFVVAPFKGVLCLFLLDMGLVAGRGLRNSAGLLRPGILAFGLIMPPVGAVAGLAAALVLGLSTGGTMLLMTLCASASYIAVPAAMRVALPEANPSLALTLALGITFPFNLTFGIPLYLTAARLATGG